MSTQPPVDTRRAPRRQVSDLVPVTDQMRDSVVGRLGNVSETGMLMLAFVFQSLAVRRPDPDAGVYAYAKAGFGEYLGFFSAFGYWASACVGNVTYWVLIMSTIGAVWPALGDGDTLLAAVLSTIELWAFFLLAVLDCILLGRRLKKKLAERFGGADKVEKGIPWYAAMRALQLRVMRLPKPQVKRGAFPA